MAQKFTVAVLVLLSVTLVAPPTVKAQDGLLGNIFSGGLLRITGRLFCTLNGGSRSNGTATPVFPNAVVQLQCAAGNIVSSTTTDSSGAFSILLDPLQAILSSILQNCKLVVPTPLSTCDSSLPAFGVLSSLLQSVGSILAGLLRIINIVPIGFNYLPLL